MLCIIMHKANNGLQHVGKAMEYTLADAAKAARVNRSTLFRAIKSGKLSARRLDDKTYRVDASELARVYELQQVMHKADDAVHQDAQGLQLVAQGAAQDFAVAVELAELRVKVALLEREREAILVRQEETIADLRKRLDAEQEERRALQRLLAPPTPEISPERSAEPSAQPEPAMASRSFLSWLRGGK